MRGCMFTGSPDVMNVPWWPGMRVMGEAVNVWERGVGYEENLFSILLRQ